MSPAVLGELAQHRVGADRPPEPPRQVRDGQAARSGPPEAAKGLVAPGRGIGSPREAALVDRSDHG